MKTSVSTAPTRGHPDPKRGPYRVLLRDDAAYPGRLRALEMAPAVLYVCGCWDDQVPAVAIVGARAASGERQALARQMARAAVRLGHGVVSGGAIGIDAAAHRGALDARGPTCVVLGTGIDVVYPQRHAALYAAIVRQGGSLISSFPLGTPPKPWHFPARNRLIAALVDVVVVVEAGLLSGSRFTAEAAVRLGKPVLAVPGSPGTDALLLSGASSVRGAEDLVERLRHPAMPSSDPPVEQEAPDLQKVRAALGRVPQDLSELSLRAGLPPAACAAAVLNLELLGACLRVAGGRFIALDHRS
ncbi:MAG: DNA-processing protein DprA [Myxococcales bacterium]|nr:DNA-processing protein DprA [Myxococcales bacterium]